MSSRDLVGVVRPGGCLVVDGAGFEAAVQDADQAVGDLAQGGVVFGAAGTLLVVVGAGTRRALESRERLGHEGVDEPVVMHEAGQGYFLLAGGAGDRRGSRVVLASLGRDVAARVIAEFREHPGAENRPRPGWLRMISAAG
jgi:hypothetical protein